MGSGLNSTKVQNGIHDPNVQQIVSKTKTCLIRSIVDVQKHDGIDCEFLTVQFVTYKTKLKLDKEVGGGGLI